ncbi:hypothetical protein BS78_05G217800 [Paspalum vaginatum]|nr:hypothetical protein BS78_05G217800 [Paspalum vaginatum]
MGGCLTSPPHGGAPSEEDEESMSTASRLSSCCVAFQSLQISDKRPYFLCYDTHGGSTTTSTGSCRPLRLNGEGVTSPYSRFYIEPSRDHSGLVHIRCCYDNKYWAAAQQREHDDGCPVVVGTADEAEEDVSKPTCTLFRVIRATSSSIRLLHVHLDKYVCLPSSSSDDNVRMPEPGMLSLLAQDKEDIVTSFTIHDLSGQFVLPRHIALKGDNGKYLRALTIERHPYLQFSGRDVADEAVLHTVHTNVDGTFRVRSSHVGKLWRRSPNWIWTDTASDDGEDNDDTLFRSVRLSRTGAGDGGSFALQNMGNEYFCRRLTTEGKRSCLNAGTPTITADARLQLEEPVVSREICNVVFDLSEPRIYGRYVVTMATASALNGTTSNSTAAKLTLEYTDIEKRTWASTVSLKLGVTATIVCSRIPAIVEGGRVEVSADEFSGSYSWGSPVDKETAKEVAYEVTVPPRTRVTVTSTATRALFDIPFAYTQKDTLVDGRQVTYDMDDGLYTGVNCYDFKYVISEEETPETDPCARV